jgi:hypothetical protein
MNSIGKLRATVTKATKTVDWGSGSFLTRRWRKPDSNPRSPG